MSSDWVLDPAELASKFNSKTKSIILNTPHNPIGKVFSLQELTMIADLCKKWDVLCIADEVYEHLVYKPYKHIRIGEQWASECELLFYNYPKPTLTLTEWSNKGEPNLRDVL